MGSVSSSCMPSLSHMCVGEIAKLEAQIILEFFDTHFEIFVDDQVEELRDFRFFDFFLCDDQSFMDRVLIRRRSSSKIVNQRVQEYSIG